MRMKRAETIRNYGAAEAALRSCLTCPEHPNRGLQVTDKRRLAWQKRLILNKKGSFESVCRELPRALLAA